MKNRFIESQIAKAKLYHRNKRGDQFDDGVLIRHAYHEIKATDLSYWDDAVFVVNDYRVALWWTHPRMRFLDLVGEQASLAMPYPPDAGSIFDGETPNYKKLGRSRKKIVSYTLAPLSAHALQRIDAMRLLKKDISETAAFEVRPTMHIRWHGWCKAIDLCVPFEVRSPHDLKQLVALARRLLTRQTSLQKEFGDYIYSNNDWLREHESSEDREWVSAPRVGKELI